MIEPTRSRLCRVASGKRTFGTVEFRPPVSLDGWSGGDDPAPDVQCSGSERSVRLTRMARRRLGIGVVVLVLATAATAAVLERQEQRDAKDEQRRLGGLLQLTTVSPEWATTVRTDFVPSDIAPMEVRLLIRNDGPRPVTVTEASAGDFVLANAVLLPPETTCQIVMRHDVGCAVTPGPLQSFDPGVPLAPGPLKIMAQTESGNRTITLGKQPYDPLQPERLCALWRYRQ